LHPYFLPVELEASEQALADPQRTFRLLTANVSIKNHNVPSDSTTPTDRELLKVARRVQDTERPVVVAGDFNDAPWSFTMDEFQEISPMRNFRVGRGFYNTFEARNPLLRVPIDHIFTSTGIELVKVSRPLVFSSDHLALFAVLTLAEGVEQANEPIKRTE